MKLLPLSLLAVFCLTCSSPQSPIALNWYARIDHAPGCGERNVALIAGKDTLLCPLNEARFNGDSLIARSVDVCYFIDLKNITDYQHSSQITTVDCAVFEEYISAQVDRWPRSFQEKELVEI